MTTVDELRHAAKLEDFLFRKQVEFDAKYPHPTEEQLTNFWLWSTMVEEQSWDDFYGSSS